MRTHGSVFFCRGRRVKVKEYSPIHTASCVRSEEKCARRRCLLKSVEDALESRSGPLG